MRLFFYILLLLSITINGCRRDPMIPIQCNCLIEDSCIDEGIPHFNGFADQPAFYFDTAYIKWLDFNPTNPNEFIYYKTNTASGIPEVIKFNIASQQKEIVVIMECIRAPKWGRKGWILLNSNDAYIYKVKDNGDSLTQLPLIGLNYYPEWNYDGNKFLVEHRVANATGDTNFYSTSVYDIAGTLIDSIPEILYRGGCWNNINSLLLLNLTPPSGKLSLFNVNSNSVETILDLGNEIVGSNYWCPDGQSILYTDQCGIHTLNIITKEKKCLIHECSNNRRTISSISFISNKVLCLKSNQKYVGDSLGAHPAYLKSNKIIIMNLDGSDEQEINIQ